MILESGTATGLLGIELRTMQTWIEAGLMVPKVRGVGRGARHKFSKWNVFALSIVRDLRRRGFSVQDCGSVLQRLSAHSPDQFQFAWKLGRRFILAVGPHALPLLSHVELFDNPHLSLPEAFDLCLPVAVIDTQAAFEQVSERLSSAESESKREAKPCPT